MPITFCCCCFPDDRRTAYLGWQTFKHIHAGGCGQPYHWLYPISNWSFGGPCPFDVSNTRLQGTIPEELYNGAGRLQQLSLNGCNFSGTISTHIGLLTGLSYLLAADNQFQGTIPEEMSLLTNLRELYLNRNNFTGTLPEGVCERLVRTWDNRIVADCAPDSVTGVAAIACTCCTECCETGTAICHEE